MKLPTSLPIIASLLSIANAQSACPSPSGSIRPSVASGYAIRVVATGLSRPRGLAFDSQGRLLVVESGSGIISSHVISDANGCTVATNSSTVVSSGLGLNHGIQVNGSTLYASSSNTAYSWSYDPAARTVKNQQELVTGMIGSDHSTRTLELLHHAPGMMVISRGSTSNLDPRAATIDGGVAQVRAFNLANRTGVYNWTDGLLLAWGVRNEVGLAEHPVTGGIFGVENSADQINRSATDVSNNNPAEELNFFGYLNGTPYANQGGFFGYPWCLSAWNTSELPKNGNLSVGSQFAFDPIAALGNQNRTDQFCASAVQAKQVFQAHMAPLDIKFNNSGNDAWITFHGSWDRQIPIGYRLSVVRFSNGQPALPLNSTTAEQIIVKNADDSACPNQCFRPVAVAFDRQGRIFMTSDSSGEIYMVSRNVSSNGTSTTTSSSSSPSASSSTSTGSPLGFLLMWFAFIAAGVTFYLA